MKTIKVNYTVVSAAHSYHGDAVHTVLQAEGSVRQITVDLEASDEANALQAGQEVKVTLELPDVLVKAAPTPVKAAPAKPAAKAKAKAPRKPKAKAKAATAEVKP